MAKKRKLLTDIKSDLPTIEQVNEIAKKLSITSEATTGTANEKTVHTEGTHKKTPQKSEATEYRAKKHKKVTAKGTVLQNLMIDSDLLIEIKRVAFTYDRKMSDIINDLIEKYLPSYESDLKGKQKKTK